MDLEENFPRGGRKPSTKHAPARLHKNIFSTTSRRSSKPKVQKPVTINQTNVSDDTFYSTKAESLTYSLVRDEMLILGRIRNTYDLAFDVSLPGKIYGTVQIQNISTTYNKLIKEFVSNAANDEASSISDLFQSGQYVPVKVIEKKVTDTNPNKLFLSVKPSDINKDISFTAISKKMLLWGAISGVEDHGYLIDLGIPNARAFLPSCNVSSDMTYLLGQNIWCIVKKVDITSTSATIHLTTIVEEINKLPNATEYNLNNSIPGSKFGVTVDKLLKNGLQVKASNNITGYIADTHLKNPFDAVKNYKPGDFIECRLLYVMPITKFCYFSMHELDSDDYDGTMYKYGDLCKATVIEKSSGIYVSLNDDSAKGFISYRRLKMTKNRKEKDVLTSLERHYPLHSEHETRIVEYMPMERIYICTFEAEFVKEAIFAIDDLKYGELYSATVTEICVNGLRAKIGKVFGFILNDHLSDIVLSADAIRKKFKVGQQLKVRVWKLRTSNNNLLLTMRPSLLQAQDCLWRMDDVKTNTEVTGVVTGVTLKGFVMGFYDQMQGWLPLTNCGESYDHNSFSIGQVIKSTVLYVDPSSRIILTLSEPRLSKRKRVRIGQRVDASVQAIVEGAGLKVKILPNGAEAFVPAPHLSSSTSLCNLLLGTYAVGDTINDLMCIEISPRIVLSLREAQMYKRQKYKVPKFEDLRAGFVIRCSFESIDENGLILSTPLIDHTKTKVFVDLQNMMDEKISNWKNYILTPGQPMLAKVMYVDTEKKLIYGDTKLSSVYRFDINVSVDYLEEYMDDLKRIKSHFVLKNNPISNYSLGQHVKVVVKQILEEGGISLLELPDGIQAFTQSKSSKKNLKVGDELTAVVLWLHYNIPAVEVSVYEPTIHLVNKIQNESLCVPVDSTKPVQVLLARKDMDVVICSMKGAAQRQLVFLPTICCENDWSSKICLSFTADKKLKVIVKRVSSNGKMIGISKVMAKIFEERYKRNKSKGVAEKFAGNYRANKNHRKNEVEFMEIKEEIKVKEAPVNSDVEAEDDAETVNNEEKEFKRESYDKDESMEDSDDSAEVEEDSDDDAEENIADLDNLDFRDKNEASMRDSDEESGIENDSDADRSSGIGEPSPKKRKTAPKIVQTTEASPKKPLGLSGAEGFYSDPVQPQQHVASSDSEDDVEEVKESSKNKKKMSTAERAELAKIEEERIRQKENELMDLSSNPQNPDQFERLILANPNNSEMWIKYITYHISITEIEKARTVIKKALDAILFKEEQERFNIWMAWLNLENSYGTKESFDAVLKEAVRYNDALEVNINVLGILSQSRKTIEYEEKVKSLLKNKEFKSQPKLWLSIAKGFFEMCLVERARSVCMQPCKDSLSKNDHFNIMVQFALLEFTQENTEYGESLFQNIIMSCPQRVDVWCTYVDQFLKKKRPDLARNVLERAASQKLPVKKMKTIFKKYLEFEREHGDEESQMKVKNMAKIYVDNIA